MSVNLIDNHKLIYHPGRVAEWMTHGDCFPIYVEIGLTSRCNHRCIFCAFDWVERDAIDMEREVLLKALESMAANGVKSIMFAGVGESMLHGDAPLFIRHAANLGIKVAVTTNGLLLTPQKAAECLPYLTWIRFSCNAGTPQQYSLVHNTDPDDFDRVLANIRFAAEFKKNHGLRVEIGVQSLLLPESCDSLLQLAALVKEAGADNLQLKPYSQHPASINRFSLDNEPYLHLEPALKAQETNDFSVIFRKNTIERIAAGADYDCCHGLPFFAMVTARGQIIPCDLFYADQEVVYGDLHEESFTDIWRGERRRQVVARLRARDSRNCRQACRLDPINRYLHRLKFPQESDAFI